MTRFGVMKHLRVLEDAGLVVTRRSGREKLHFLNPVPIRLIHDRWIDKYTERQVSALADLKSELEEDGMTTHDGDRRDHSGLPGVHQGDARGDLGRDHQARVDRAVRLRRPGRVRPAPRRQLPSRTRARRCGRWARPTSSSTARSSRPTRRAGSSRPGACSWTPSMAAEGFTRLTYEIEEGEGGVSQAHGDPRARGRAADGGAGARRAGGPGRGRRLELGAQRPQDAARDRRLVRSTERARRRPCSGRVSAQGPVCG